MGVEVMRYLKRFNESTDISEQWLKDIFLELEDNDFKVIITKNNFQSKSLPIRSYDIHINKNQSETIRSFKLSDVFETILTSESYMKDGGWFINSIRFCTNKNEWFSLNSEDIDKLKDINNLRKEVLYINYLVIEFKFKS
jgi:hypothetical protein